jgi:hypothetical protein
VIANEDETEIAFSWKITLDGLPPSAGGVIRIAGGRDRNGAGRVVVVALRGAGFFGVAGIGLTGIAGREGSGSGFAVGGAFRATGASVPTGWELLLGLVDGSRCIAGDELKLLDGRFDKGSEDRATSLDFSAEGGAASVLSAILFAILSAPEELSESTLDRFVSAEVGPGGLTREAECAGRAFWDGSDGVSECDTSACGAGKPAADVSRVFVAGGAGVCEVTPPVRSGKTGGVPSATGVGFSGCRKRLPSGPSPPASSTMMPTTANKHTAAIR